MYGIFTYIWAILGVNVGKYSIHGAYGLYCFCDVFDGSSHIWVTMVSRPGRITTQPVVNRFAAAEVAKHLQAISDVDHFWVNYNDLTVTSLEPWLVRGIIPKWP
jgi:hypothetical protein